MNQEELKKIANHGWLQRWSGSYTFLSCSIWGPEYYKDLQAILGMPFSHTLFVHKKGTVDFYVAREELDALGKKLATEASQSLEIVKKYVDLIKKNTDILSDQMNRYMERIPNLSEFKEFLTYYDRHLAYHGFIKEPVDYLSEQDLSRLLPQFTDGRKYSEKIYSDSERLMRSITEMIAKKENQDKDLLTCLTQEEFENYLGTNVLPEDSTLSPRFEKSALYFENGKQTLLLGEAVDQLEKFIHERSSHVTELKGIVGFKGKATGIARIIPDPHSYDVFNNGDILITGMTRPEFLPLVTIASAIVTDSGGILSHAAITARELKKPCITGTQSATKFFKDGDLVEVDAEKGIVKIIK